MPRRPDVDRPTQLCLKLPESLRVKLDLLLYSPLEGRVPRGRYQDFFMDRVQEYISWRRLDLAPFGFQPGFFIAGPKEMVWEVEKRLMRTAHKEIET